MPYEQREHFNDQIFQVSFSNAMYNYHLDSESTRDFWISVYFVGGSAVVLSLYWYEGFKEKSVITTLQVPKVWGFSPDKPVSY